MASLYLQRVIVMVNLPAYNIFQLGDAALTIDFGNHISRDLNDIAISLHHHLQQEPLPAMIESAPAYSSVTIFYDVLKINTNEKITAFEFMKQELENRLNHLKETSSVKKNLIRIPVCYDDEFATDINTLAEKNQLARDEIIRLHTSQEYHVYMLGFLPGFAYMGEVNEQISCSRKQQPVPVAAGSVGIAGLQTGIYPFESPGGWQIIGRTPVKLFETAPNPAKGGALKEPLCLFEPGDTIQFYSITRDEFENIKTRNT